MLTERQIKHWRGRREDHLPILEEDIDKILNANFDFLPNTKKFAKEDIRKNGRNSIIKKGMMVKEDLIEEFNKSRKGKDFIPNYDFSLVPDIIWSKLEKFTLICRDKINGIEIGPFTTDYNTLIKYSREIIYGDSLKDYVERTKEVKVDENACTKFKEIFYSKYRKEDFNLDEVRMSTLSSPIPVKITCNICGTVFWVNPYKIMYHEKTFNICPECRIERERNIRTKHTWNDIEKRITEIYGKDKFDLSIAKDQFKTVSSKITIKCNICGTKSEHLVGALISGRIKNVCPECLRKEEAERRAYDKRPIREKLEEVCGPDYDFSESVINTHKDIITFKNIKTGKLISQKVSAILNGHIDPTDTMSGGELLCYSWLERNHIQFEREKIIHGIKGRVNDWVRVDYMLSYNNTNYIIEYNGVQHYSEIGSEYLDIDNKYSFQQNLDRDNNVKKYCKENNIIFIEIPYTFCSYKRIDEILTRVILQGEDPSFIEIPEIEYKTNT